MKHVVLADLHGWDFVTEYKQIPLPEDESDEKRIRKVLKDVESQREKRNRRKRLKKPINLSSILDVPSLLDHILTSFLFFLP